MSHHILKRNGRTDVTYHSPEIIVVGDAVDLINGLKMRFGMLDGCIYNSSPPAYQLDEE